MSWGRFHQNLALWGLLFVSSALDGPPMHSQFLSAACEYASALLIPHWSGHSYLCSNHKSTLRPQTRGPVSIRSWSLLTSRRVVVWLHLVGLSGDWDVICDFKCSGFTFSSNHPPALLELGSATIASTSSFGPQESWRGRVRTSAISPDNATVISTAAYLARTPTYQGWVQPLRS